MCTTARPAIPGKQAAAVGAGARQEETVETRMLRAFDATLEDLRWCDGLLPGTPENFGYMSGALKDFFDRTYNDARELNLNWPYALFIAAGNDGTGAVREIDRILRDYPMKKIAEPLIARGEITPAHKHAATELGQTIACGLAFGIF